MSVPELQASLLSEILPYLLPPSPLPQELLAKSLLQRLVYLPPSPSDLDAYLSPFPSTAEQPISSRLKELSRGHQLDATQYTREGAEVYARKVVEKEEGGDGVEIWFEHEAEIPGKEGRGWVYHSARLPSFTDHIWALNPLDLPPVSPEDEETHEDSVDPTTAPEGYWSSFDDEEESTKDTRSDPRPHVSFDIHDYHESQAEDAYWAQYSRPATAPITPGIQTPGIHHAQSASNPNGVPHSLGSNKATSYFAHTTKPGTAKSIDVDETALKLHESLTRLGLSAQNGGVRLDELTMEPKGIWKETGDDVRARIRGKIGSALNDLWREFTMGLALADEESAALEWLSIARPIIDQPATPPSPPLFHNVKRERVVAKLEVLRDMFELLNEEREEHGLWRLVEGVIKRGAAGEEEAMDEVTRQQMYYE